MLGARHNDIALCDVLIQNGANPTLKDREDATALTHAVIGNSPGVVRMLLPISDEVLNASDALSRTPLLWAVSLFISPSF